MRSNPTVIVNKGGLSTSRSGVKVNSSLTRNTRGYAQNAGGRQGGQRRPFPTLLGGSALIGLTAAGYILSQTAHPISADSPSSHSTVEQDLQDPSHRILPLTSASASDNTSTQTALSRTPLSALIRTYLVYTFTSLPLIVDYSPTILSALTRSPIPGVSTISEWVVRKTFFDQFVGGDDVKSCLPVMETLREEEIGTMLVYSVEVEEHGDEHHHHDDDEKDPRAGTSMSLEMKREEELKVVKATEERVEETLRCIRVAGDFERRMKARTGGLGFGGTYVAIKLVSPRI